MGSASLDALAAVARDWLNPSGSVRLEAVPALQVSTGYSQVVIERALDAVFGELSADAMRTYLGSLKRSPASERPLRVLHMAAGNIFTSWLHGVVITLLLGHRVWLKPSSRELLFGLLWKKSVTRYDPPLAEHIQLVTWDEKLAHQVDAVVAYGSDDTLHTLKKIFTTIPFVGYGHKVSTAIFFHTAFDSKSRWEEAALQDIQAFDLEGCLSPQIFYAEGPSHALEQILKARLPHSKLPLWKSFDLLDTVWKDLARFQTHLSCIGVAGSDADQQRIKTHFANDPTVRICGLGDMQRPPLNWPNGGVNLGEFLLKCKSTE